MNSRLLSISFLLLVLSACHNDPEWQHKYVTLDETIITTRHEAHIAILLDDGVLDLVKDVRVEYATMQDFADYQTSPMIVADGVWKADLYNLQESTTYYLRYEISPTYLRPQSTTSSFITINPLTPDVQTLAATDITATSAVLHGVTSIYDNYEITERGFYYSLLRTGEYERKQLSCGSGEGNFSGSIEALRANATYYYVAYSVNANGVAYGDTLQFNTLNPYE